jgi:hypothetical protein
MKKFLMLGLLMSVVAFGVEIPQQTKIVDEKIDNEMLKKEINDIIEKAQMDMVKLSEKVKKEIKNDKDYEKIRNLMKETIEYNKKYLENLKEINKKIRKDIKEQWENQEINFDKIKENIEKEFTANPNIIIKPDNKKTTK